MHRLFRDRWSPRSFSDRPVKDEDLKTILEAARWAASSYNEQPWRFVVARKSDGPLYGKLLSILVPFNQAWAKTAPVLVITAAKRLFSHNGTLNLHAQHDAGAALAHILLQATDLGLHAHAMAGIDRAKARQELAIPEDYEPVGAVAIGYLGTVEQPSATRERKALSEIAFNGHWGVPLEL
ncbi:MAG: nitroreductase family protein [Acidobacteriota bacterium]|nr:nitroreductase family protein [Acidobacteriota bacterium]